ncbi:propionate catabolism operon regulatory protein PrpR [Enterocloster clostridioformis]|uniref:sigma-54-dependent transcriptional regulator n=1 Tax=Enterocloster clostridioformis TaxID=1531 RepID=UPI00080C3775|nr:sigma-54-dependent transcriptional regulator [Enterocloster clostridioformis]ANU46142.1 propionate catabolism operon regulatory protein PrpR [Lachnoclostridium sp. YL32]NDO29990.1 sigma-54-dependent transcriptional regulator [Enterocloster clostridioformis]OXE67362.1 propionate catabolism operon regulatory protein PrpR [Enterocloster clostridioformis]QQQ99114.1 PrpR N-terminal domain-containing protein [Enterocloster clostridioformis]
MERKYRILGIAPYENLKNAMVTEAAKYEDIEMVVYTGNLEDGAQLALQHMNEGFDILISRGGTAELIRKIASIPVIEITLSINDILRAILLVGNLTEAYAVVGYPTVTQPAHVLCEMMNYRMNIITIHSPDELDPVLKELKAGGCNFILCDVITEMMAREAGVEPILILSGPESIDIAIDYSINMCRVLAETKARGRLFTRALDMQGMKTVIMKQDGSILFSTYNEKNISSVTGYLKKLAESPHSMSAKAFHMIENRLYSISAEETTFLEEPCYIFCLEQNPFPVGGSKHGIRFSTCTEVSVMYSSSFYSLTSSARLMEEKIRMINQTTLPVMILGERGSGKNQLAAKLYLESSMQRYPYITIDCQVLNERTWNYIISNYNSPLNDKNNTIFISNLQALSRHQQEQLLSFLVDTNAHKRNRIILSCSQTLDRDLPDPSRNFIDYLPCTTVYMPPLRELTDDIHGSSNLYLNAMNVEMSKQIVGFTPEALALLMSYRWPDNFMQLKRVLAELVMLTSTAYIQRDTVFEVIEKEKRQYVPTTADLFDYNRPLGEMTREIVKVVLSQCGGNQTLAAKRLGIGRTTLWRYLNETD